MKKNILTFVFAISVFCVLSAQNTDFFKVRFNEFVRGDISVIGNTIVGRSGFLTSPSSPYNKVGSASAQNDASNMQYINIDKQEGIFSSSSASFNFQNRKDAKIVFAGLYWSGTYPYEKGKVKGDKYEAVDDKRFEYRKVKIKFPQKTDYVDIEGEILFTGTSSKNEVYPYVVYADITKQINALETKEGVYTLANQRATQGYVSGGVSAGWALVLVYEDVSEPLRNITIYDGFTSISKERKTLTFSGFKTPNQGEVKAKILGLALEGDLNMAGDELILYTKEEFKHKLSTKTRGIKNFFNSSITIENDYVETRTPNSLNTLGFDLFSLSIPNKDNQLIGNNLSEIFVELSSKGDRYSLSMFALSVEASEYSQKLIKAEEEVSKIEEKPSNITENIVKVEAEIIKKEEKGFTGTYQQVQAAPQVRIQEVVSTEIERGFYTISGAFSSKTNLENFLSFLKKNQFEAKYFYNSQRKLYYIYLSKNDSLEEALKNREIYFERGKDIDENLREIWILEVKNE